MQTMYILALALPMLPLVLWRRTALGFAIFVALAYIIAGMMTVTSQMPWFTEVAFICAGYVTGNRLVPRVDNAPGTRISLGIMTLLLLLGTVVFFSESTFLMLFPGFPVAFAFGQATGMLIKSFAK